MDFHFFKEFSDIILLQYLYHWQSTCLFCELYFWHNIGKLSQAMFPNGSLIARSSFVSLNYLLMWVYYYYENFFRFRDEFTGLLYFMVISEMFGLLCSTLGFLSRTIFKVDRFSFMYSYIYYSQFTKLCLIPFYQED